MKKLFLLLSAVGLAATTNAQNINVPTTHKTLIMKFTADWCPPCGGWGWNQMESLIADAKSGTIKANIFAVHNSTSDQAQLNVNSAFSGFRSNLDTNFTGIPTFAVGLLDLSQSNTAYVESKVSAQTAAAADVNAGFMPIWAADKKSVKIAVNTKFFKSVSGTYSVGVYLVEDNVSAKQASQGTGSYPNSTAVNHHNILRTPAIGGTTGMNTIFGKQLAGTSFTSTSSSNDTFNLPLTTGWNQANISIVAVVWKKNGAKWDVANSNELATFPTRITNTPEVAVGVYPNPAGSQFTVALGQSLQQCVINMYDITGKKVAQLYNGEINGSAVALQLNRPADLAPGTYLLHIESDKGTQILKLQLQ